MTRYLFSTLFLLTSCATTPTPATQGADVIPMSGPEYIVLPDAVASKSLYPTPPDVQSHPVYKCRTPREVLTVALRVDMGVVVVDKTGERIESWWRTLQVEACEPIAAKVPAYGEMLYMYRSFAGLQKQCRDAVNDARVKEGKTALTTDEKAVCEFEARAK